MRQARFSLLVLFLFLLVSCATHKTATKSDTKEDRQLTAESVTVGSSEQTTGTQLEAVLNKLEQRDIVVERETREYYQPVKDSAQGSHATAGEATIRSQLAEDYDPPNRGALKKITKERITIKAKTETAKQVKSSSQSSDRQQVKKTVSSQSKQKSNTKQAEQTSTTKATGIKAVVIIVLIALGIFFVIYILHKVSS